MFSNVVNYEPYFKVLPNNLTIISNVCHASVPKCFALGFTSEMLQKSKSTGKKKSGGQDEFESLPNTLRSKKSQTCVQLKA